VAVVVAVLFTGLWDRVVYSQETQHMETKAGEEVAEY